MTTEARAKYESLIAELETIAEAKGLYLTDTCVDAENATAPAGTDEHWRQVYDSAVSAAASRASDAGHDINDLIGRVIY